MIDINKLRVASPCSVDWETMSGDERARHCESCKLNVYNIAGMTNAEVQHLVSNREGRLCIRLFRRADGTVLTKDCPVGFRAYQKRVAKFAGATLSVLFNLVGLGAAQSATNAVTAKQRIDNLSRGIKLSANELGGVVVDPNGASIPEAKIKLFKEGAAKPFRTTKSADSGRYTFPALSAGKYRMEVALRAFKTMIFDDIEIIDGANKTLNVQLEVGEVEVTVGIYAEEPMIDMSSSSVTTTITRRHMDRLPF